MANQPLLTDVFEFAMGMEALGRRAGRAMAAEGLLEVDARLVMALVTEDQTQAGLARSLAMDSGQIARTVRRLTDKGLVEPSPDAAATKNAVMLRLTAAGQRAAHEAGARKWRVFEEYFRNANQADFQRVFAACTRLADRHYFDTSEPFVRPGEIGDFGLFMRVAAVTLQRGYFGHFDEKVGAFLAQSYIDYLASKDRGLFLVAEFQGGLRGGLVAIPRSAHAVHMPAFVVDIHYLYQSIGAALLNSAVPMLRQLGYSVLSTAAPRDPEGSSFFKHHGWVHCGTRETAEFGPRLTLDDWEVRL